MRKVAVLDVGLDGIFSLAPQTSCIGGIGAIGGIMYRLYLDEIGNDSLTHVDEDNHRYLSLSGIIMDLDHVARNLEPNMNWIKVHILHHDPDEPIILHRHDIVHKKISFEILNDATLCEKFDNAIIKLFQVTEYVAITAFLDKRAMLNKTNWKIKDPYLYLMKIIIEKYTQFLERKKSIGDIMPEKRGIKQDKALQQAFLDTKESGTYFVGSERIKSVIRANNLKFREKKDNIAGLQLCDLLAHPSHMIAREMLKHSVKLGIFAEKVKKILNEHKYDRSKDGKILGYGIKIVS